MITAKNVSKSFKLYNTPADRLKEIFSKRQYHRQFRALDDISFELKAGETLGIVGENGAGKSTLLKILTGITIPDSGTVKIQGRITGLLELGTGFNAELSGIQNIILNATLLGMKREEIDDKMDRIIAFAELGPYINNSLKLYSSGMVMRLAFSIAINADPQCFVIDEALSVGDAYFQQKCIKKITQFKENGGAIVFVSHDMNAVKMICDKAMLLEQGRSVQISVPEEIINRYNYQLAKKQDQEIALQWDPSARESFGTFEVKIRQVRIVGENSQTQVMCAGENAKIIFEIESKIDLPNLTVGFDIRDRFGQVVFGINTAHLGETLPVKPDRSYEISFSFQMNIGVGQYTLSCALHTGMTHEEHCFHWSDNICRFEIAGILGPRFIGLSRLTPEAAIHEIQPNPEE
jgi:lipopolysaccharide transport system ATP-binding protein